MATAAADDLPRWVPASIRRRAAERPTLRKLIKFGMVSLTSVATGQALLVLFSSVLDWPGVQANIIAVSLNTLPAFYLNRIWVWRKGGQARVGAEIVPFFVMTFLGLILSSLAVAWAESNLEDFPLAVNLANIAGFGALWIVKFFVLDKVLFKDHEPPFEAVGTFVVPGPEGDN